VERYNLNRFDQAENGRIQVAREEKIVKEPANNIPKEKMAPETKKTVAMKIYEVKPGDTLVSVSKQFMLAIEDLKRLNELENSNLFPGQLLLVSK
jgi:LysM repeat protein